MNPTQQQQAKSALDELLEGKDDGFKYRVLNAIVKTGVKPSDPIFMLLAETVPFRLTIEDVPEAIDTVLKRWFAEVEKVHDTVEVDIVRRQETAIADAASNLVSENLEQAKAAIRQEKAEDFFRSILPAAGVLTAAFFVGAIAGVGIPRLVQPPLDPSAPRQLTLEEANALQWIKTDEGRLAKKIMDCTGDYLLSGQCEKDVKELKVNLTMNNRKAHSGFCILWVKPFGERNLK